jgi:integrase/recombinase XerD
MSGMCDSDSRLNEVTDLWRENRCISGRVVVMYCRWIGRFVTYCHTKELHWKAELTLVGVLRFAKCYARSRDINGDGALSGARPALHSWREALQTLGESLPPWQPTPDLLHGLSPVLREFAADMYQHRGSAEGTVRLRIFGASRFLAFLRGRRRRLRDLRLSDLDTYVMRCAKRYAPATVTDVCCMLRSFTRFLQASGRISADLAESVSGPVRRRGARPHRTLPWGDVQRILRAIDRSTPLGKRDYALLLLMGTYGLGAGETIRITLDDIDWRAATLRIVRPKTQAEFVLPLLPAVARSLVNYLRYGRPIHAPTRHLFVRMSTPHGRLSSSSAVRDQLIKYARAAGVSASYLGSHVLRHTHAGRQMELGTPPKLIGDILGHRSPDATSAYLRVATGRLRQMALPVPR